MGKRALFFALTALVVLLVGAALTSPVLQAEPEPHSGYSDLFMPLLLDGFERDDFAPATAVTFTPSPTSPPTATWTPSPTPTLTPTLEPTPTLVPGGAITGKLLISGTPAPLGLGLPIGPALYLLKCFAGECETVARTGAEDAEGTYVFREPAPLAEGEYYQVFWYNESSDVTTGSEMWLGTWYGPRITEVQGGEEIQGGDFELADLKLRSPTHGTGFQGLPIVFAWHAREVEVGTYRWGICECCQTLAQRLDAWLTQSLGMETEYEMISHPPNTATDGTKYCWFIRIQTADGYGESYHIRMLWFIPELDRLSRFGLVDPADWGSTGAPYSPGLHNWSAP